MRPVPSDVPPPLIYAASVTRLARRPNPEGFVEFLATKEAKAMLTAPDWKRPMTPILDEQKHPLSRRIFHWVMALSILIMIGSGWRIYNASPIFPFTFPEWITLGGDGEVVAGAPWRSRRRHRHRLAFRGDVDALASAICCSLLLGHLLSGHFRRDFLPLAPRSVMRDFIAALSVPAGASARRSTTPCRRRPIGACCARSP